MPHVSPQPVDKETAKKLSELLFKALTEKDVSTKLQKAAFHELLTSTEKRMLGKRLMAVSLISQGASMYQVGKSLRLSYTTVAKLQERVDRGSMSNTEKLCNVLRKGPLQHYLENLLKPLPRYGTSPASLFKKK